MAGKFPPKYIGAVMSGQALGGIFPAVVDLIVVGANIKAKNTGFACFLIATLVLIGSFLSFSFVRHSLFYKFYSGDLPTDSASSTSSDEVEVIRPRPSISLIVKRSWEYLLAVWVVFTTTLTVFPAITVLVESEHASNPASAVTTPHTRWADDYFTPVTCFLLFNVGDYAGRQLASVIQRPGSSARGRVFVVAVSVLRVGFIPLFLFCNAAPNSRTIPVVFAHDWMYVVFMAMFAVSNGYLGNLAMLHGPKIFEEAEYQEAAAMVLVAFLVLGTSAGSALSYPLVSLL